MPTRKIEGEPRALEPKALDGFVPGSPGSREGTQTPALPLSHPRDHALEHGRVRALVISSE